MLQHTHTHTQNVFLSSQMWSLQIRHHLNVDIIDFLWIEAVQFDASKHAVTWQKTILIHSTQTLKLHICSARCFYLFLLKALTMEPFSTTVMFPHAISANWQMKRKSHNINNLLLLWVGMLQINVLQLGCWTHVLRCSPPQGIHRMISTCWPSWTRAEIKTCSRVIHLFICTMAL